MKMKLERAEVQNSCLQRTCSAVLLLDGWGPSTAAWYCYRRSLSGAGPCELRLAVGAAPGCWLLVGCRLRALLRLARSWQAAVARAS
jgi:hypothetical protein